MSNVEYVFQGSPVSVHEANSIGNKALQRLSVSRYVLRGLLIANELGPL